MLISAIAYLKKTGQEWRNVKIYGQEFVQLTSAISKMNLFLHGIEDFHIANEDTLKNPCFIEDGKLKTFNLVLANPPYSIKNWDREAFSQDKWGRNFLGTPPQGRADYAFFQHILKSMDPKTGRCAILFPHGVLFRDEENEMRKNLVKEDLVECVIGLGPNLFFNSPMEACIVICRSKKAPERRGKVLFINAKEEVTRKNAESYLEDKHIQKIANAYEGYKDIDNFARVVTNKEIENNNCSLNISLYAHICSTTECVIEKSVEELSTEWSYKSETLNKQMSALEQALKAGD